MKPLRKSPRGEEYIKELFERIEKIPKREYVPKPLALQLGIWIGDHIANEELPSLSCDWIKGHPSKVIQVTGEETKELERLSDIQYKTRNELERKTNKLHGNKEWNDYLLYRNNLDDKYLPKTLEIIVTKIDWSSEEELKDIKRGIEISLWNSDFCSYHCDEVNLKIESHNDWNSKIIMPVNLTYTLLKT